MSFFSGVIGGLGAAGGGYGQALAKIREEEAQSDRYAAEQKWREEESQRRTNEEQARITAQGVRDTQTHDYRTQTLEADAAAADAADEDRDRAYALQRDRFDAEKANRPPEPHFIAGVGRALEMNDYNEAATRAQLTEQHASDPPALQGYLAALDWQTAQYMAMQQEMDMRERDLSDLPATVLMDMTPEERQEYERSRGGIPKNYWGSGGDGTGYTYNPPKFPFATPDGLAPQGGGRPVPTSTPVTASELQPAPGGQTTVPIAGPMGPPPIMNIGAGTQGSGGGTPVGGTQPWMSNLAPVGRYLFQGGPSNRPDAAEQMRMRRQVDEELRRRGSA